MFDYITKIYPLPNKFISLIDYTGLDEWTSAISYQVGLWFVVFVAIRVFFEVYSYCSIAYELT